MRRKLKKLAVKVESGESDYDNSKICFAVGWEGIINSYPENNERI